MKLVICGAGQVGQSLVHYLAADYDMVVIDVDGALLEKVQERYDVQTIRGSASDPGVLRKANFTRDTILIAVTGNDDVNLMACQLTQALFSSRCKVARLRNEHYFQEEWKAILQHHFAIDLIFSPERNAAESIVDSFSLPYAFDTFSFLEDKILLIGFQIDHRSPFIHQTINTITQSLPSLKIIRLIRNYQAFIPKASDTLGVNDALYLLVHKVHKRAVMKAFGYDQEELTPVILFGASLINAYVIQALEDTKHTFTVIDEDPQKMTQFSSLCPKAYFVKGNPLNPELLGATNIHESSYAISATSDDTTNILSALMAHSYGVEHCIALVRGIRYFSPLFSMGMEKMILPSQLIVARLLQKITKTYILSLYPLQGDDSGTVIEALVQQTSRALGPTKAMEDKFLQILALEREEEILWNPKELQEGDRVLLTTLGDGYKRFQRWFSPG